MAVVAAPLVGPVLDRYGSGMVVGISSGIAGLCAVALGAVNQIWLFYLVYVPGRATFASPLELGTSVAVSNWFIRRRPFALALNHVSQGSGTGGDAAGGPSHHRRVELGKRRGTRWASGPLPWA